MSSLLPAAPKKNRAKVGAATTDSSIEVPDVGAATGVDAPDRMTPLALDDAMIATWLAEHPDFFEHHAELLAGLRVRHQHGGRAVSLVERQVRVLREKNEALEARHAQLIRIGAENDAIGTRFARLARDLLRETDPAQLPQRIVDSLSNEFAVPQVAIRLWGVTSVAPPFSAQVSEALKRRAGDAMQPYCGPNSHPEAAGWLPGEGAQTASIALLSLRVGAKPDAFGLLVLGSADAGRFQAGMGTAYLARIAELASASLSRLLVAGA